MAFQDTTLSRMHARVRQETDGQFVVEDLGSLNGSYVNSSRIESAQLEHGDRIRLGSGVRLQFQLVDSREEEVLVRMYQAATMDGLTGLTNRRALDERLQAELAYALRHKTELCALIVDIDFFKKVNDTHGHLAGDEVLRCVSALLDTAVRSEDLVGRYGGEEFVVIARSVSVRSAGFLAERLRKLVEDLTIEFEENTLQVTASFGVAGLSSLAGEPTVSALLAAADEALYRAKETGRNRVECHSAVAL